MTVELTSNYLKLILTYLSTNGESGGVLIHCISGWDRTPLYVSLVRMSLWADGAIHQNLSAIEILYLTVNYDWFLFDHYLQDRCGRGEDIFYFCFFFLTYMTGDEFSIHTVSENTKKQQHSASHKISIRPDDHEGESDEGHGGDSYSSSFGSCGRSWEMTSGYMNQYVKSRASNACLYIDDPTKTSDSLTDKSLSCTTNPDDISQSDDALFSFDDGDEEFYVLRSSCDDLPEDSVPLSSNSSLTTLNRNGKHKDSSSASKNEEIQSTRASRLLEVSELMKPLYSAFVGGTL